MAILTLVGGDADTEMEMETEADFDTDNAQNDTGHSFQFFTIRNLFVFLAFFGWAGIEATNQGVGNVGAGFIGAGAGLVMVFVVAVLFWLMSKFTTNNKPRMETLVGKDASVYLTIPKAGKGRGKINVEFNGALQTLDAVSNGKEIKTGSQCKVVALQGGVPVVEVI